MPRYIKPCIIHITDHAQQQYRQRGGRGKLQRSTVRGRLMGALAVGLEVVNEAVEVPLGSDWYGVCRPELWGGWSVVTVVRKKEVE